MEKMLIISNGFSSEASGPVLLNITKTYLYNFDPLKPHFYIVKLGFTGVHIIFLISAQNIDCGHSLEPPHLNFLSENLSVFGCKIFNIFE